MNFFLLQLFSALTGPDPLCNPDGTIEINEKDYKGEINLTLPNKDGSCNGSYSLQADGRGTWQISCTNNMGAAGSLKWVREGGTTGQGRDYKDKKVQFTVASNS